MAVLHRFTVLVKFLIRGSERIENVLGVSFFKPADLKFSSSADSESILMY